MNFSSPAVLVKDDSMMNNVKNYQYEYDLGTNGKNSWNRVNNSSVAGRSRLQAREHLVAERKRREKLGQLFINLSKLVPGIKKLDKASILEDAIDYIKILEERIRSLEKEEAKRCSELDHHPDSSSFRESSYNIDGSTNEVSDVSAIEVKIMNRSVLIKMLCKKQKGFMSRIHMEMEKMNLCEEDIRVMPFGSNALDITILAQEGNLLIYKIIGG
ncbi:UNVERIFIED_CONTAM: Transcription factor [Sesamum radiatum]|uniref:Transcription factor n=1 Tax=Sesamum radiatum TaxID=300843 RepID=A0AAW2W502_SESRA